MAPTRTSSDDSKYTVPSLEEIIFSCGICQATVSELYPAGEDNPESHHSAGDDGMGTKLWIGNCVHIFCGRHLDGGGVAFHPQNAPSQAECPVCVRTEDDHEIRNLYGIRGLTEGKFDPAIPGTYVKCPPVSLDGTDPGVEALRFQYSRMKCYSQEVTRRWKSADRKRRTIENTLHKERKQHRKLEAKHEELQMQKDEIEKKLQGWEGRKDQIRHYMGAVSEMAADIQMMRRELVKIGYNIAKKSYGLDAIAQAPQQQPPMSHPIGGHSSTTLVDEPRNTSSSKRKRLEDNSYRDYEDVEHETAEQTIRHMPPPPLRSARKGEQMRTPDLGAQLGGRSIIQPTLRFMQTRQDTHASQPVRKYENGRWQPNDIHAGSQKHQDPLYAMQSMRLHSAASPARHFQTFAAPQDSRTATVQYQHDHSRMAQQHAIQPPRLQPAGLYSAQPRYDERPQGDDFTLDMNQQHTQLEPLHNGDVEMYEDLAQSQSLARPSAIRYGRGSNHRSAYSRSEAPTRHPNHKQPTSSVLSPFFRRPEEPRSEDLVPTSFMRSQASKRMRSPSTRSAALAHARTSMNAPSQASESFTNERAIMRGEFFSDAQYGPQGTRPRLSETEPMSQRQTSVASQRASYTPSGSQIYSRPTYTGPAPLPLPPPSRPNVQRFSQPYRTGRITLPPAPTSQRGWDPQVSRIPGVRGAGPPAHERHIVGPPYSARGPLYSQAGSKTAGRR